MKNEINYKKMFEPYYDSFISDLIGLLKTPSVLDKFDPENKEAPFGKGIKKALDYLLKLAKKDGFKVTNLDNYCGFIDFGEGEETVIVLCHIDVVPTTGNWTNPPFEPVIKDGRIYARGSQDDKGPLMSMYYALKMMRDEGYLPNKKVRFFFGCDEETGSRGLEYYLTKYPKAEFGFSPDADFPCIYAEKGISKLSLKGRQTCSDLVSFKSGIVHNMVPDVAEAVILNHDLTDQFYKFLDQNNLKGRTDGNKYILYGKSAHGSIPEAGRNAALYLAYFLSDYLDDEFLKFTKDYLFFDFVGEKLGLEVEDDEMGHTSNNPGVFNVEKGRFEIILNMRYTKSFDFSLKMEELQLLLDKMGIYLRVLSNSPVHYVPKDSVLIQALLKSFRKWTSSFDSKLSEPISIGGGTYARAFPNAVAFGALFQDDLNTMHMPDESASIDNLILSAFIYEDAIKNICG